MARCKTKEETAKILLLASCHHEGACVVSSGARGSGRSAFPAAMQARLAGLGRLAASQNAVEPLSVLHRYNPFLSDVLQRQNGQVALSYDDQSVVVIDE